LWLIIIRVVVDYAAMIRRHITGNLLLALADTPAVLVNGARQEYSGAIGGADETRPAVPDV
jgi:hypothetical protein